MEDRIRTSLITLVLSHVAMKLSLAPVLMLLQATQLPLMPVMVLLLMSQAMKISLAPMVLLLDVLTLALDALALALVHLLLM